jgi:spore germination protein GerM
MRDLITGFIRGGSSCLVLQLLPLLLLLLLPTAPASCLCGPSVVAQASSTSAKSTRAKQKQRLVRVYLMRYQEDYSDPENPLNLFPVSRRVNAAAPLDPTLKVLLAGPTAAEKARGYRDISYGIKLVSVNINGETARANFTMPPGASFSGDLSPDTFAEAVRLTAMQFRGVKKVVVCLDGTVPSADGSGEPAEKC